jgi:hypothetical protein
MNTDELNAYYVATYVKKLEANIKNITTDASVNADIINSIKNSINKIKDTGSLLEVATAFRNFTPFYLAKNTASNENLIIDATSKYFGSEKNMNTFNKLFNSNLNLYDYRVVAASLF